MISGAIDWNICPLVLGITKGSIALGRWSFPGHQGKYSSPLHPQPLNNWIILPLEQTWTDQWPFGTVHCLKIFLHIQIKTQYFRYRIHTYIHWPHRWYMVKMFASIVVFHGFESRSGQTKNYKIGIWCFSAKHAALRWKSKDGFVRNQDNE